MPNNRRILVPRKRKLLMELIEQRKTNKEIQDTLGRPDLDVDYFRANYNDYKKELI